MRASEIKDLCIAMEALSRIAGYDPQVLSERIRSLVDDLLKEVEERIPSVPQQISPDNEIPF